MSKNLDSMMCENPEYKKKHKLVKEKPVKKEDSKKSH